LSVPKSTRALKIAHTERRKDQLVESNTLEHRDTRVHLGERESTRQEAEPLELNWSHEEAVCHEPCDTLKVERRRGVYRCPKLSKRSGPILVQVMDLNRNEVVILEGSLSVSSPKGGDQLCNSIGYATKNLFQPFIVNCRIQNVGCWGILRAERAYSVGDHRREHCRHRLVSIRSNVSSDFAG